MTRDHNIIASHPLEPKKLLNESVAFEYTVEQGIAFLRSHFPDEEYNLVQIVADTVVRSSVQASDSTSVSISMLNVRDTQGVTTFYTAEEGFREPTARAWYEDEDIKPWKPEEIRVTLSDAFDRLYRHDHIGPWSSVIL